MSEVQVICGDCLEVMRGMPAQSVDLVFTSPPYEAARQYAELQFNLRGQEWVDWAVERFVECLRVCKGLVAWNVEGQTRDQRWSATPALLMADLHRRGVHLRHPAAYVRDGIPGSGGREWIKNRWEFIVCGTNGGYLPWSDNTVMGHPPKFGPGGAPSHRRADGTRVNGSKSTDRRTNGVLKPRVYVPPVLANPGNWLEFPNDGVGIDCGPCGGGHMGSDAAVENEAPFPEKLPEFFVRSFCPPGGVVLDAFTGSGTTAKVALKWGRKAIAIDIRESQCELTRKRIALESPALFVNTTPHHPAGCGDIPTANVKGETA